MSVIYLHKKESQVSLCTVSILSFFFIFLFVVREINRKRCDLFQIVLLFHRNSNQEKLWETGKKLSNLFI